MLGMAQRRASCSPFPTVRQQQHMPSTVVLHHAKGGDRHAVQEEACGCKEKQVHCRVQYNRTKQHLGQSNYNGSSTARNCCVQKAAAVGDEIWLQSIARRRVPEAHTCASTRTVLYTRYYICVILVMVLVLWEICCKGERFRSISSPSEVVKLPLFTTTGGVPHSYDRCLDRAIVASLYAVRAEDCCCYW